MIINNYFLGISIRIENTFGNGTPDICDHFKQLTTQFGKVKKLGLRRFQILRNALNPTVEQISQISNELVKASQR